MRAGSQITSLDAGRRMKANCHAIAERDRPGFIEQQDIDIASGFHGAPTHCKHIALKDPVHSRDANRAE